MNAIFAGAEVAVLGVRAARLRELETAGSRRARSARWLRDRPDRLLAVTRVGVTLSLVTAASSGEAWLARPLEDALTMAGAGLYAESTAFGLVIALVSFLAVVLGELVPRSLALRHSEAAALIVATPLAGLARALRPLAWLLTSSSNLVLRLFNDRTDFGESRHSPEELRQLLDESGRTGALDPRIAELAVRAFDLAELRVVDVMLPRHKVVAIPRGMTGERALAKVIDEGYSRFPVFDHELDKIVGYLLTLDLLSLAHEPRLIVLEDLLRPPQFVAEHAPALDVLRQLQRTRAQMAVVLDEHGSVAGLVTIEDLVEELVGEILSETEVPEVLIKREDNEHALVDGSAPVRDVNRTLALELPEGEGWSTIAGLCTHLHGWIPAAGTVLEAGDGTMIEILDASARRIRTVRITRRPATPSDEP